MPASRTVYEADILLVEDSSTQAARLQLQLAEKGLAVRVAVNARQALARIRERVPDAVLCDVLMPGMDGFELCRSIRATPGLEDVCVVMLTELSEPTDIVRALSAGAVGFMVKPCDPDAVLERLSDVLATRALSRGSTRMAVTMSFVFGGETYNVSADQAQILDLLFSSFENGLAQKRLLNQASIDLKRAEEEASARRTQLQALFDHMLDGFAYHRIVTDAAGKPVDYVFLEVNKAFEQFTGLRRDDIIGRRVTEVLPGIAKADFDWIGTYGRVALTGEPVRFEQYFAPQQHWYAICAYSPAPGHFAVTFANVTERKQAELTLRESEERHRILFESSQDAIMTLAPPSWAFTSGNPACVAMFRCRDVAHFLSFAPWELSPVQQPDGRASSAAAREMIDQAMVQGRSFFVWTHQRADGEAFPATVLLTRVELQGDVFLQATVRDITAQEQAEVALRDSEQRFRSLFEGAPNGILVADVETRTFRYANPAVCAMLGYSVAELTSMQVRDIHPASSLPAVLAAFAAQARGELRVAPDLPCVRKDGEVIFATINTASVEISGRPCLVGFFSDTTARKQAEEALHTSREQLQAVLDTMNVGVAVISPEMEILSLNRQMHEWFPAVEPGRGVLCYREFNSPPRTSPCVYCPTIQSLRDGEVHEAVTDTPAPGGIIHFKVVSTALRDVGGRVVGAVELVENVTERMRAEKEQERIQAALHEVQKLAAVGTLACGMSHEINNPIMGIMNYAQLIHDRLQGRDEALAEFAGEIMAESRRVAGIVCDLSAFAARDTSRRVPALPADLVEGALATLRNGLVRDQIRLELDLPRDLPAVACDPRQIEQVLSALLNNACDALNERYAGPAADKILRVTAVAMDERPGALPGLLPDAAVDEPPAPAASAPSADPQAVDATEADPSVSRTDTGPVSSSSTADCVPMSAPIGRGRLPPATDLRPQVPGSWLRFTIEDHGVGISPAAREHLFEPFFTTKDRSVGAGSIGKGLGLFGSYAVVQEHGGSLSVQSEPGAWTRFHVDLPVAPTSASSAEVRRTGPAATEPAKGQEAP